jgi:hypothetical protein
MRNISEEIKTHIVCPVTFFPRKPVVYELKGKGKVTLKQAYVALRGPGG